MLHRTLRVSLRGIGISRRISLILLLNLVLIALFGGVVWFHLADLAKNFDQVARLRNQNRDVEAIGAKSVRLLLAIRQHLGADDSEKLPGIAANVKDLEVFIAEKKSAHGDDTARLDDLLRSVRLIQNSFAQVLESNQTLRKNYTHLLAVSEQIQGVFTIVRTNAHAEGNTVITPPLERNTAKFHQAVSALNRMYLSGSGLNQILAPLDVVVAAFPVLQKLAQNDFQNQALEKIRQDLMAFRGDVGTLFATLENRRRLLESIDGFQQAIDNKVMEIQSINLAKEQDIFTAFQAGLDRVRLTLLILGLGVLVIGWFLSQSIGRSITEPLDQLNRAIEQQSSGLGLIDLSDVQGQDEIGAMARTVIRAGRLQSEKDALLAELSLKNQRIMESISYAKRIQEAILPNLHGDEGAFLRQSLILWMPKDVVGGDFYWSRRASGAILLGVIDCTGHSVPGALMTMTVKAALDQAADLVQFLSPAAILAQANVILRQNLHQDVSEAATNDGADVGLCLIRPETRQMVFSGARINLYACKNGYIQVIKGDRHSIGYKRSKPDFKFTEHELNLQPDQKCYLATDGFLDQAGGRRGLSFGNNRFEEMLRKVHHLPFSKQEELIRQELNDYMGPLEQRDDITLVGFNVP